MIVSPDPIPDPIQQSRGNDQGILTEKILEIRQEMLLINKHKSEHITNDGEIRHPDSSCPYCQRHCQHANREDHANESPTNRQMTIEHQEKNRKKMRTSGELERIVVISGKNGFVNVPSTWRGKRVRIVLVDED